MHRVLRYLPGTLLVVVGIAVLFLAIAAGRPTCSCPSSMGHPTTCSCPVLAHSNPLDLLIGMILVAGGSTWLLFGFARELSKPGVPIRTG